MYTGSTPTDSLMTMAGNGDLGDVGALAKNLIATTQGKQMLQRFFDQYLDYAGVTVDRQGERAELLAAELRHAERDARVHR